MIVIIWEGKNPYIIKVSWSNTTPLSPNEQIKVIQLYKPMIFDFEDRIIDHTMRPGSNYFHTLNANSRKLSVMYRNEYGEDIPAQKPHWDGTLNVTNNNFLSIDNLNLLTNMSGVTHTHTVLKNISFQDIELKLVFNRNDGSTYNHFIPLNAPTNYSACIGAEGTIGGNKKDYQMGLAQIFYYYLKIGDRYIGVKVEVSIVLLYHGNDFEPLGVIDAVKFFPQIKFAFDSKRKDDPDLLPNYNEFVVYPENDSRFNLLTLSGLPTDIDIDSCNVDGYKARVKMTANNNSMHHVEIRDDGSGNYIDYNHFRYAREEGIAIPKLFEKYFDLSLLPSNMPSFFTDSNDSEADDEGGIRKFPFYHLYGAVAPPTWAYIFDYLKPNLTEEHEIQAVYGRQDLQSKSNAFDKERGAQYLWPQNSNPGNKKVTLTKKARQAEYDNIHFHGYMGKYADNNQPVIHAPICGYCCFHLHWRWSQLNYNLNAMGMTRLATAGGSPNRFNGWETSGEKKGDGFGLPLIPPNQSLKIAVTNENKTPFSRDSVLNPTATPEELNNNIKTVWYSVDLLDYPIRSQTGHLVFEQGAGYAFRYNPQAERIYKTIRTVINVMRYQAIFFPPGIPPVIPPVVVSFLAEVLNHMETPDMFEIVYRLMRFFNWETQISDVNQVPNGNYHPSVTEPSMEKL